MPRFRRVDTALSRLYADDLPRAVDQRPYQPVRGEMWLWSHLLAKRPLAVLPLRREEELGAMADHLPFMVDAISPRFRLA